MSGKALQEQIYMKKGMIKMIDYSSIVSGVAEIITYAFPIALIFGVTAKLSNLCFSFIFNRKIEL